jgi:hypothetical protein
MIWFSSGPRACEAFGSQRMAAENFVAASVPRDGLEVLEIRPTQIFTAI